MSGALTHSACHVVAKALIDLGLGTHPDAHAAWPVWTTSEPSSPDNVITIEDTAGRMQGSVMFTGEQQEQEGIQIRVRGSTDKVGSRKADAIKVAIDQGVYQQVVTLDGVNYCLHSINRTSGPLSLGREEGTQRRLFTINAVVSLRMSS